MRENLSVTQNEYILEENDVLISKTDTQSNIVYTNSRFVEVSGFDHDELIGSPHNMVRHPDMPPEVFKDMWDTLKRGETWQGIIKNRRKNGDHYWVQANAVPIQEGGRTIGYASIRVKAQPDEIRRSEIIYRKMRDNPSSYLVKRGQLTPVLGAKRLLRFNRRSIAIKLVGSGLISGALAASMLGGAILIASESERSIDTINHSYVEMMGDLYDLEKLVTSNRRQINLSLGNDDRLINGQSLTAFERDIEKTLGEWERIQQSHLNQHARNDLSIMDSLFIDVINNGIIASANSISSGDYEAARQQFSEVLRTSANELDRLLEDEITNAKELASATAEAAIDQQDRLLLYILIFALFSGIIMAITFNKIIKSIRRPLSQAKVFSLQVAAGNLESKSPVAENNELGAIINNMNLMRKSLSALVYEISGSVSCVVPAIDSILDNNTSMASRIEQQAAAVQETAASMEEITSIIRNSAENASTASHVSLENVEKVGSAESTIEDMKKAMDDIREQSQNMEELIKVIDGIAFQTNILALNASVEAARAGEHGRGFSVVAQEVRNLASKSAEAAKAVQESIERTIGSVEKGVAYSSRTADVMGEISASSGKVNSLMSEISASAKEQEHGVSQIGQAISEIDRATQESSHAMNEYADSTLSLKSETQQLENSAEAFQTGSKTQSAARPSPQKAKPARSQTRPETKVERSEEDWSEF